jgi:hypothetical protein
VGNCAELLHNVGVPVNPLYGNVPVCEPVNEPVNGSVNVLNCVDDDMVFIGNAATTCVELDTIPVGIFDNPVYDT